MKWRKYWTPVYAFDKIRYLLFLRFHPELPWITPAAIRILKQNLQSSQTGLEVGSGKGTAWIASRIKHLISIEHDEHYFSIVKQDLLKKNIRNAELVLKKRNDVSPENSEYIKFLEQLDKSFDLIFIDGIYRDLCIEILIDKLNPMGILVLDDCQRFLPAKSRAPYALKESMEPLNEKWKKFKALTINWKQLRSTDGMRDTCIYFKP